MMAAGGPPPGAYPPGAAPPMGAPGAAPPMGAPMAGAQPQKKDKMPKGSYPAHLIMPFPKKFDKMQALFFTFLGFVGMIMLIPHFVLLLVYGVAAYFLIIYAWFKALFTGKYPKGVFEFVVKLIRYQTRISAYAGVLAVGYPKFGLEDQKNPVDIKVEYPKTVSRLWLFLAMFAVIPVALLNGIYGIWAGILNLIGSFMVLFKGSMSKEWFEFIRKQWQQKLRVNVFMLWMCTKYPPFSLDD